MTVSMLVIHSDFLSLRHARAFVSVIESSRQAAKRAIAAKHSC